LELSELRIPFNFSDLLIILNKIDLQARDKFERALIGLKHSKQITTYSLSTSYIALINAIECLMPPPEQIDLCSSCNRAISVGPTKNYYNFLDRFAPDDNIQRKELYKLRSKIVHGHSLLAQGQRQLAAAGIWCYEKLMPSLYMLIDRYLNPISYW
jgi:hypothetical protein